MDVESKQFDDDFYEFRCVIKVGWACWVYQCTFWVTWECVGARFRSVGSVPVHVLGDLGVFQCTFQVSWECTSARLGESAVGSVVSVSLIY